MCVCLCVCLFSRKCCYYYHNIRNKYFHFIGNELIHQLTNDGRTYTLRVDLTDYDGESIYAKYRKFSIGPESDNYTLHVSDYDDNSTASKCNIMHCVILTNLLNKQVGPFTYLVHKSARKTSIIIINHLNKQVSDFLCYTI